MSCRHLISAAVALLALTWGTANTPAEPPAKARPAVQAQAQGQVKAGAKITGQVTEYTENETITIEAKTDGGSKKLKFNITKFTKITGKVAEGATVEVQVGEMVKNARTITVKEAK